MAVAACALSTGNAGPAVAPSTTPTAPPPAAARERVQVLSVTDGDTIRVSIGGRSTPVRYIGIDTPETVDPLTDMQCFGKEAAEANRRLVEGKMVELEKDLSETDKYDRLLRYVYVDITGRGLVMVNEELVRLGFAKSSSYPPDVKYQDKFRLGETQARTASVGLWGSACAVATSAPTAAPTVARTVAATAAPTQQPAQSPAPTLFVTIATSRYGFVSAGTLAGASCTAQAVLPSGRVSTDQDLMVTRTASASGVVTWNYGVSSATNAGTGTHTITCTLAGVTRSASAAFTVQ
jgi:micrococcal nuclease